MLAEAFRLFVGTRAVDRQTKEPSPTRFLEIFPSVSGMKPLQAFQEKDDASASIPDLALKAGVVGTIVVGSCANPASSPKDIDIFLVFRNGQNADTEQYSSDLMTRFNIAYGKYTGKNENGRLDVLAPLDIEFKLLKPKYRKIIKQAQHPVIYAFNLLDAQSLHEKISNI